MRRTTNWWWGCELSGLLIQTRLSGFIGGDVERNCGVLPVCPCGNNALAAASSAVVGATRQPSQFQQRIPKQSVCLSSGCPEVFQINTWVTQLWPFQLRLQPLWPFKPSCRSQPRNWPPLPIWPNSNWGKNPKNNPKCLSPVGCKGGGLETQTGVFFLVTKGPGDKRRVFLFLLAHQGVGRLKCAALSSLFFYFLVFNLIFNKWDFKVLVLKVKCDGGWGLNKPFK